MPSALRGVRIEFVQLVIAGLVWVVGSAWNNAFQDAFKRYEWLRGLGPFAYAAMLTVGVGVLAYVLKRQLAA